MSAETQAIRRELEDSLVKLEQAESAHAAVLTRLTSGPAPHSSRST